MDKAGLRRLLRERVRAIPPDQRDGRSRRACDALVALAPFRRASVVMLFLSMSDEIDTTAAIQEAWSTGKTVAVPKVDWSRRSMVPVAIQSLHEGLAAGRGGLRNPVGGPAVDLERIDLVVAPGLGFDRHGHRLGRGAGYYDRFLADPRVRAWRCGLCYVEQIVDAIPVTGTDQNMEWVVTDAQVFSSPDRKGI
ncbi:MAG: 5-formyltetrahydrofolate cyclo-ligase [Phycisphaerae bacterium]|nr:5-formyltetrahydrofolate cyclo-ligase [Phycisphaerae bacterium]